MRELLLNETNIAENVIISSCIHEMHAGGRSDSLTIRIHDPDGQFDKWKVKTGATVEFKVSGSTSGKMFLYSLLQEYDYYILKAYSMPVSGTIPNTKPWEQVHFLQIGEEIAKRHGLEFESYGLDDIVYQYRAQENESDFKFFGRLCTFERAALMIYNKKLIVAYEPYLESIEALTTIDTDGCIVECEDKSILECSVARIVTGAYSAEFRIKAECERIWTPEKTVVCQNDAEALRFAMSELREKNKMLITGNVIGDLMSCYAPGVMVNIINRQYPSWSGEYFIYKVRHDYGKNKSKIFFRKKLEGY